VAFLNDKARSGEQCTGIAKLTMIEEAEERHTGPGLVVRRLGQWKICSLDIEGP